MPKSSPAKVRASIELKRVREALPTDFQMQVRSRVVMDLEHGAEWLTTGGSDRLTAAGVRRLAEAYARAGDFEAARWCQEAAEGLDREDELAKEPMVPAVPASGCSAGAPGGGRVCGIGTKGAGLTMDALQLIPAPGHAAVLPGGHGRVVFTPPEAVGTRGVIVRGDYMGEVIPGGHVRVTDVDGICWGTCSTAEVAQSTFGRLSR